MHRLLRNWWIATSERFGLSVSEAAFISLAHVGPRAPRSAKSMNGIWKLQFARMEFPRSRRKKLSTSDIRPVRRPNPGQSQRGPSRTERKERKETVEWFSPAFHSQIDVLRGRNAHCRSPSFCLIPFILSSAISSAVVSPVDHVSLPD